ncbi:nucleotide sugar dehydrogenase [Flavobacterium sp. I3-2]|uniref:nucleotide sugar dehydrogenase n=1 Tax=Flavobacterium sp. I3-2 TaxID=2748319 RepID=UPI00293BEBCD|nr:nucleotide sugar dehydrogenase [Flavobacterium sp. I3-2]
MKKIKLAIIGLGYVGLPLARLFATKYAVVGFDINQTRIDELRKGIDATQEIENKDLQSVTIDHVPFDSESKGLYCTNQIDDIKEANVFIVTVPTPVDKNNRPNLTPLHKASETISRILKKGDVVIYESTVYPGVTEDECIPILERISSLKFNVDFFAGYSPERINPGDKKHTVDKILKVTSGSTPEIGVFVDNLYKSVIVAGTHLASSIKVAEASKVIENSQRDINIAFVNELAKIFALMDIDTNEVLEAASTKWNFLPFKPGLVGGHCIGVDPFYLAQKAQEIGYYSELILTSRRLNDSMGPFVASQIIKLMIKNDLKIKGGKILNLGITFKENCPDIRNSKAIDVIKALEEYGLEVVTFDPWANPDEVQLEYGFKSMNNIEEIFKISQKIHGFDAVVLTVAHQEFLKLNLRDLLNKDGVVYDVKGALPKNMYDKRL